MSYHLEMEKGKKPNISGFASATPDREMPETKPEQIPNNLTDAAEASPLESQELELHPDLAKELPQEVQTEETSNEVIQEEVKPKLESPNAKNIRALRERAERAERAELERDQLALKLTQMEQLKQQGATEKQPTTKYNLNDDDFVEAKHLKRYDEEMLRMQQELAAYKQQNTLQTTDARLKAKYPDIDSVVTADNLSTLKGLFPELAENLNSGTDLYNKAVSAYTLIKRLGIVNEDIYNQEKELVKKNAVKPRPVASVSPQQSDSPLTKANAFAQGLTEDLKIQLRKEMEAARRNH